MQIHRLLGAIYEGPSESSPWQSALQMLREQLEALSVTLILRPWTPDSSDFIVGSGAATGPGADACETHLTAIDPLTRLPDGEAGPLDALIGHQRQWSGDPQDQREPVGAGSVLSADIQIEGGIECCLRAARLRTARPFSEDDKAACQILMPHIKRAIQLHARLDALECERQLLAATVDRMQVGIISFSQEGETLETNRQARRMLAERDGIWLSGNTLRVDSNQESRGLRMMIQAALERSAVGYVGGEAAVRIQAMSITRPSGRAKLGVIIRSIPLKPWSERRRRPAVVVFLRDPAAPAAQPSRELVRHLFGLTPMQAQLALLLAEGLTLDEAAGQMNVRRNTARSHLRAIFHKTGVTRQTMLVRLLLNSAMTLGLEPGGTT